MTAGTRGRAEDGPREPVFYSALHDLERIITTHLFVICPTNSGSTFLRNALATSRRTWNLQNEGRDTLSLGITYKGILTVKGRSDSGVRFDRLNELRGGDGP